ncbi:MAG: RdgB/HAM1 family non-canonical purine NTP pyrophosphatase [Sphingobacteriaceae bacterium]|nr:RdgB/HAM1 family non-canonical purine NTP pyrophosphatase [Sphingobacteriaceae bacterium]
MNLIFATHNAHKLEEIQELVAGAGIRLRSLTDIGCTDEIEETGTTFEANASIKSRYVFEQFGLNCFADDSGLVVDALHGEPGIYSARYSGSRDPKVNLELVLERMEGQTKRTARFVSVISLVLDGQIHLFRGEVEGTLATECTGVEGFGYDPIFIPNGYECTFAEMSLTEKNRISHRSKALSLLFQFLKTRT